LLGWACLLLSLFAVCDALLSRDDNSGLSKWWLLAGIPLIYLSFNIIFTSLLVASGFRALRFPSTAMKPTLSPGDKFIYDVNYYRGQQEHRGELVVMRIEDALTVKRIAATGGDAIRAKDRQVFVNGEVQREPFIQHTLPIGNNPRLDTFGPIIVPAGKYFVLGDNRDISRDSRLPDFGLVDRQSIVGKPLYIYRLPWEEPHWERLH
jgi:signal peptidase I